MIDNTESDARGGKMLTVNFYDNVDDKKLKFAVIISKTQGKLQMSI